MDIVALAKTRYTTKSFDPGRKLPDSLIAQIEELLRYSPSSTNSQPWHFFFVGSDEAKSRVAESTSGFYAFNQAKVMNASHVIVFCTRASMDDAYLEKINQAEDHDGRFSSLKARTASHQGRLHFANMHRFENRDAQHWMEKQTYLAVGTLLLGAAALGVDACPMEGFDQVILNEKLGLRELGYTSTVIVALGYRSADDFNAKLPKSRWSPETIITRL